MANGMTQWIDRVMAHDAKKAEEAEAARAQAEKSKASWEEYSRRMDDLTEAFRKFNISMDSDEDPSMWDYLVRGIKVPPDFQVWWYPLLISSVERIEDRWRRWKHNTEDKYANEIRKLMAELGKAKALCATQSVLIEQQGTVIQAMERVNGHATIIDIGNERDTGWAAPSEGRSGPRDPVDGSGVEGS